MKPAAGIFVIIWALVMFQPAFAIFGGRSAYGNCTEIVVPKSGCSKPTSTNSDCSKKKINSADCTKKQCPSPTPAKGKDCGEKRCNPSLGCSLGNFYVHAHHQVLVPSWHSQKIKLIVTNDNRIAKSLSECWHPPEA